MKWLHPPGTKEDAAALRMLERGEASPSQQQRALRFIIEDLCATYDMSYKPDASDVSAATHFSEGRRFVGNRIVYYLKCNIEKLETGSGRRDISRATHGGWGYTKSGRPRKKPGRKPGRKSAG